jgi:hypothetical protein
MQDTLLTWILAYVLAGVSVLYFIDDLHWSIRLLISVFWPLTLTTIVVMLIITLIKN